MRESGLPDVSVAGVLVSEERALVTRAGTRVRWEARVEVGVGVEVKD